MKEEEEGIPKTLSPNWKIRMTCLMTYYKPITLNGKLWLNCLSGFVTSSSMTWMPWQYILRCQATQICQQPAWALKGYLHQNSKSITPTMMGLTRQWSSCHPNRILLSVWHGLVSLPGDLDGHTSTLTSRCTRRIILNPSKPRWNMNWRLTFPTSLSVKRTGLP